MQDESVKEYILSLILKKNPIETFVTGFEKLAKEVAEVYDKNNKFPRKPDNYRVTDLINPMQAYYDIKNPNIEDPRELTELFAYGNFVEQKVMAILEKEKNFAISQGKVDGRGIGMLEVSGRIDARIGDCIVEIKSSESDITTEEELLTEHPQDLEQLLLYSLFTSRGDFYHYLVYVVGKHPSVKFRIFKVTIKKMDKLVGFFKDRLESLKTSLNNGTPTGLGKCRYFNRVCKFRQNGMCGCDTEKEIDISPVKESTYIKLLDDRDSFYQKFSSYSSSLSIRFWDLFQPRKWSLKQKNPFYYEYFEEEDYYNMRKDLEDTLIKSNLGVVQVRSRNTSINDKFLSFGGMPLLVRFPKSAPSNELNEWYLAQLGLISLLEGKNRGYIFTYYQDGGVGNLHEIVFKIEEFKENIINSEIEQMKDIYFNGSDYSVLPLCPDFIRKNCGSGCYCRPK